MNRQEAKDIVGRVTAHSLRALARAPERWNQVKHIPDGLTDAQVEKVRRAMKELADKVEPREGETIDQAKEPT